MRIFADENIARAVVEGLRTLGHDVSWGAEFDQGATDPQRLAAAVDEARVVLTEDNDFAALVIDQGQPAIGLIRISLFGFGRASKPKRILEAMADIGESAEGKIIVIEATRIRSRPIQDI